MWKALFDVLVSFKLSNQLEGLGTVCGLFTAAFANFFSFYSDCIYIVLSVLEYRRLPASLIRHQRSEQ